MKNIQYLIVFLLVIVIGLQGYYIYENKKQDSLVVQKTQKVIPLVQHIQPLVKDEDLDRVFVGNPFEQMQKMEQNMQKIFNSMNSQFALQPEFEKFFRDDMSLSPALNFKKYKDRYVLRVNIPGSDKNSIKVITKNGILSIKAKTKSIKDEKDSKFIKKEIFEGSFVRSLSLPSDVDVEKMKTEYKNGVLNIILPRK